MKKSLFFNSLCAAFISLAILQGPVVAAESAAGNERDLKESVGYFFGYTFGNMLKEGGNDDVDIDSVREGVADSLAGKQPNLSPEEQQAVIEVIRARQEQVQKERDRAQAEAEARQSEQSAAALKQANAFLEENAQKSGVKVTDSGLQYKIIEEGSGPGPDADSTVVVHYKGELMNGEVFDSSRERGSPAEFRLNQVIPGWTEGLQLMKEGGKARLYVPPSLGYGPGGTQTIPPNAVLIFDVELLEVK